MGSSKFCMNTSCGVKTTVQWKKAWELKTGENADLCYNCGSVYDNLVYCETFHAEETGWRECSLCSKRLHCGCSASSRLIVIQDFGGVWCINCSKAAICHSPIKDGVSSEARASVKYCNASDVQNTQFSNKIETNTINNGNLLSFGNIIETSINRYLSQSPPQLMNGSFEQITPEATNSLVGVGGLDFPNLSPALNGPTLYAQPNEDKSNSGVKDMQETKMRSLNISLCSPSVTTNIGLNFSSGVEEENNKSTPFQSGQKPRKILPKPPKQNVAKAPNMNKNSVSPMRVPRPPAEGRLRNQLLPRYWPKITDEELQKVSGDLNSKIVPLFEKIISASDASRIGRLVLPKACAEAYFPTINQSEGVPLYVRDIKGNDWTFQFRFWPNNNSRMYVLEGITPCIQSMQLQAGDIVTFSRIDPGGKLVIGCRKASNTEVQDPQASSNPNGAAAGDSCIPDVLDSLSVGSGQTGPQLTGGAKEDQPSIAPEHSNLVNGNSSWGKSEKMKGKVNEDMLEHPKLPSDKKRMRNISSKSRRLHMDDDDALEIRLTWDETCDLLRPPPSVSANIVRIDDYEFEEYTEPPVIGKRTVFTTALTGGQLQWAQCDKCSKWRKLPSDVYLPPKWTCAENIWDSTRSSCSSPEETNANEFDNVIKGKDSKKRKVVESPKQGCEPSGLDALATAATLGDHEEPSAGATTTRHPRHRPGCTCIVCIQPPSGKGKHKPSCVCNVCLTVKRRFKTLAMRKKKRQCDKEVAGMALQKGNKQQTKKPKLSKQASADDTMSNADHVENEQPYQEIIQPLEEGESSTSKGHIDLNSHPIREEDATLYGQPSMGIMALAQAASAPSDMYMNPNGITNLLHPQPMDTDSCLLQEAHDYVDRLLPNEERHASVIKEQGPSKADGKGSSKPAIDKRP